ncbi:hypothetical protein BH18GEM1_BH18GEM1_22740 [soil metagenome]
MQPITGGARLSGVAEPVRFSRLATARALALSAGLLCGACGGGGPAAPERPLPAYDFAPLTTLIQAALDTLEGADSAAIILVQDGRVIYDRGFGGLSPDDDVLLASAAKWLSAAVVLTVVAGGALDLDQPMEGLLPREFHEGPGAGGGKGAITTRQLLSLTSGIPSFDACVGQPDSTLEACAVEIGSRSLAGPPGTVFVYSEAAFTVAGAAAEAASGQSWEAIFSRGLAGPLGLSRTRYTAGANPPLGDGAVSTVREYARFAAMIAAGGVHEGRRILPARLVAEMVADQSGGARVLFTPRDPAIRYGLGVWRDRVDTGGGALQVSSPCAFGFVPWFDLERGLAGVIAAPPSIEVTFPLVLAVQARVREIVPSR